MKNIIRVALAALMIGSVTNTTCAETPEEWVKLGARVHGGFGSFIPVGIRIGEDAMKRLDAKPRELSVVFYQGEGVPCPCSIDGVMLAVGASPGQGSAQVAPRSRRPAPSRW
jgi:formylmethanofuran dehydrogenase subunit E